MRLDGHALKQVGHSIPATKGGEPGYSAPFTCKCGNWNLQGMRRGTVLEVRRLYGEHLCDVIRLLAGVRGTR